MFSDLKRFHLQNIHLCSKNERGQASVVNYYNIIHTMELIQHVSKY